MFYDYIDYYPFLLTATFISFFTIYVFYFNPIRKRYPVSKTYKNDLVNSHLKINLIPRPIILPEVNVLKSNEYMSPTQKLLSNLKNNNKPWNLPFQDAPEYGNDAKLFKEQSSDFIVTSKITKNEVFPKEFLESNFSKIRNLEKEKYIGKLYDTGVVLPDDIRNPIRGILFKAPASFTPFVKDYVSKLDIR